MRILLTEQQFNLIILTETPKKWKPGEIKSDYKKILNYYKETGEELEAILKSGNNKGKQNPEWTFLLRYKSDFSGKIPKGEKHDSLLDRFYREVGYEHKKSKKIRKEKLTPDQINEKYEMLVKKYNDLWELKWFILRKKNDNKEYDEDYIWLNSVRNENGLSLLSKFNIDTKKIEKEEFLKKGKNLSADEVIRIIKDGGYKSPYDVSKKAENGPLWERANELNLWGVIFPNYNTPKSVADFSGYTESDVMTAIADGGYTGLDDLKQKKKNLYGRAKELGILNKLDEIFKKYKTFEEYKGEKYIAEYLESEGLTGDTAFIRGETCNLPGKKCLYIDIYIPKYNTIIEFDGKQHFQSVKWSKNKTDEEAKLEFEKVKERDIKKNNYCLDNGINLYRVKHNISKSVNQKSINEVMNIIYPDFKNGDFNNTFDKVGYIETEQSKKYKPRNKMNTDPMANFNESIYRILNNIKKQYIY
jgi:hypothetical protein